MLIKIENGKPVGEPLSNMVLINQHPETSFPVDLTPDIVEGYGFGLYEYSPKLIPSVYEKVVESYPVKNDFGVWVQVWEIVQMTQKEIDEKNKELKNANKLIASQLLSQTDWVELPSVSNPAVNPHLLNLNEFLTYRESLRAIAVNPPVTVQKWPVKPNEVWS
jgi:hypothetical protein